MPPIFDSIIVLAFILIVARFVKRGSPLLQKLFIPSSLVAGLAGLILGPQVFGSIPETITSHWAGLPKHLINVVFAGLFLGKIIPARKQIWRQAGPMIAFGNTMAWGQYVLGISLAVFVLSPLFGTNPLAGTLIEMSFEGGHGTAAGLAPTFAQLGWPEGTDIALGLATISLITALLTGILFVNLHYRKHRTALGEEERNKLEKQFIRSGYNLNALSEKINTNPKAILINLAAFAAAIGIGWLLLKGLIMAEDMILGGFTDLRFFPYLPLFPLAMIGGLILQMTLRKFNRQTLIQRRTAEIFSAIALDVLIASAVATVSLQVIGQNLGVFIILALAGICWALFCLLVLSPRIFPHNWFVNGITSYGQSMGMTATGLLTNRLADPANKHHVREAFAYKQLAFEPFMGGGIVTATAAIVIFEFGPWWPLTVSLVVTLFWMIVGLRMKRTRS